MSDSSLRIVITGACGGSGRALAEALAAKGAALILTDNDPAGLSSLGAQLGAKAIFCDVAAPTSIQIMAAEVLSHWRAIDVLINAAGAGYERTLGMHRVSRALMPALRHGRGPKWIINVPPSQTEAESTVFSYASSEEAFERLSEAIAQEAHGSGVSVGIASPALQSIRHAGNWAIAAGQAVGNRDVREFADRVTALLLGATPAFEAGNDRNAG